MERGEGREVLVLGSNATEGGPAPWVTWGLIVINVMAFGAQLATGDAITHGFSLVPREVTTGEDLVVPQHVWLHVWVPGPRRGGHFEEQDVRVPQRPGPVPIQLTLFTHMFLHGGWAHLIGNMWFLFVFGGQVERRYGRGYFWRAMCYAAWPPGSPRWQWTLIRSFPAWAPAARFPASWAPTCSFTPLAKFAFGWWSGLFGCRLPSYWGFGSSSRFSAPWPPPLASTRA